jgi:glucan phosphorylase
VGLVFSDLNRLLEVVRQVGPFQLVFAGKAYPKNWPGKEIIRRAVAVSRQLKDQIPVIVPIFYRDREQWVEVMRHSIALNAAFFNTHRMVQQYATNAYFS